MIACSSLMGSDAVSRINSYGPCQSLVFKNMKDSDEEMELIIVDVIVIKGLADEVRQPSSHVIVATVGRGERIGRKFK